MQYKTLLGLCLASLAGTAVSMDPSWPQTHCLSKTNTCYKTQRAATDPAPTSKPCSPAAGRCPRDGAPCSFGPADPYARCLGPGTMATGGGVQGNAPLGGTGSGAVAVGA